MENKKLPPILETPELREARTEVTRVLQVMKTYYESHVWTKWIQAYKDYLLNTVDRSLKIQDFQTNMKVPIVKMYVDSMWKAIYDDNISFRVSGRTKDDNKNANAFKDFLSWAFSVSNSRKDLMQSAKEAMITGNSYGRIGMHNVEDKVSFMKNGEKVEYDRSEKYPYIDYVSCFSVFHDPSVDYMEDSLYVVYRTIMHKKDIVKRYSHYRKDIASFVSSANAHPTRWFSYDFNRVKYLAFFNQTKVNEFMSTASASGPAQTQDAFDIWFRNFATINYDGGFCEVVEYWEDDKFILMIDGHVAYSGNNPYPVKRKPFYEIHYNKVPGIPFSLGLGVTLSSIQSIADTIFNLSVDNIKLQVAPMFQKPKGADVLSEGDGSLTYEPFKVWETNQPGAIQRLDLGTPDFSGTNMVEFLLKLGEMSEGINSYSMGYQGKVERSATGVSALVQASKASLLPLIESMNQALSKIAEIWAVNAVAVMDDEIEIRVLGPDGAKYSSVEMSNLLGKFDIEFDAQALKTATRETRRAQFMDLLNLASASGVDQLNGQFFIDFRKLWGEILDTFELDPTQFVLDEKQVFKRQADFEKKKQQVFAKAQEQSGGGGYQPQNAVPGMPPPIPGEAPNMNREEAGYSGSPSESQVLKEAYQI